MTMSAARRRKAKRPARRASSEQTPRKKIESGQRAGRDDLELKSYEVGALPLVNKLLARMQLAEILAEHLPPDDPRTELPTVSALLVLLRNVLLAREPIYGVAEWAARFAPDLLDLWDDEVALLHDDRLGRCLDRLFAGAGPEMILAVVRHVVSEFGVGLDELHNDSTTVSFYGAYENAGKEGQRHGRSTPAITWGHSKDHRPDLKQLLYTLTISEDGGVPIYFTTASGNVVDDRTHRQTWDLLHTLVGRPGFLYVADCKLASSENLTYIASRGGRFVTVMPRTYKEDGVFRARLRASASSVTWRALYDVTGTDGELLDRLSTSADEMVSSDGYRLLWYHSTRKAALDAATRNRWLQQASAALAELQERLAGPRTRFRQRVQVEQAVTRILEEQEVAAWLAVRIEERPRETFRQATPGRPTESTRYVKQTRPAYAIFWELQHEALAEAARDDGVFPLLTNDRTFDAEQVLRAYKRQPLIEKRFSQFKTDFAVAPVYLKNVARIQGLLTLYFLVLLTQTLLERELRRAMAQADVPSLPIYPEGRPCTRPTTCRIVELFAPIQRHVMRRLPGDDPASLKTAGTEDDAVLVTTLTPAQRKILRLLGLTPADYGH
jgi:transposase